MTRFIDFAETGNRKPGYEIIVFSYLPNENRPGKPAGRDPADHQNTHHASLAAFNSEPT
jgi:hypothetical protein